jgi:hypothetical protein
MVSAYPPPPYFLNDYMLNLGCVCAYKERMENKDSTELLIQLAKLALVHESRIRADSIHRIALEEALLPLLSPDQQSQYRAKIGTGFLATERGYVELCQLLTDQIEALRKKLES